MVNTQKSLANLKKEMTLNHQDLLGQAMLESQQKKEKLCKAVFFCVFLV